MHTAKRLTNRSFYESPLKSEVHITHDLGMIGHDKGAVIFDLRQAAGTTQANIIIKKYLITKNDIIHKVHCFVDEYWGATLACGDK